MSHHHDSDDLKLLAVRHGALARKLFDQATGNRR